MKGFKLQKLKSWTKMDYVKTIAVFLTNIAVIVGLFVGAIFLNSLGENNVATMDFVAYFTQSDTRSRFLYLVLTLVLLSAVLYIYLFFEERDFLKSPGNCEMIFLILEVTILFSYFAGRYINIYLRPLALGALLSLLLINRRTAIFFNTLSCIVIFLMDVFTNFDIEGYMQYSALIIGFTSGIVAIYLIDGVRSRLKVLLKGILIAVPILVVLVLLEQTNLMVRWDYLVSGASAGILSVVLFMAVLPIFESLFKKITIYKLAELTDHSSVLIRRMIKTAPGTFNHSIVVANIAEACATAIGENPLLARACAYYHDMGKLRQPEFFKENQVDDVNPHDELTPELSNNIIRAHAKDGHDLLLKYHLPKMLADICQEHHGTMPILYFYAKAKKYVDGDLDIEKFSYPGPKPQSKIAAILMIADSSEAAVRTLTDRSRENVNAVVAKIVEDRLNYGQFDECEITMKELHIIRNAIVNNLSGIYHKRIEYPKVNLDALKNDPAGADA